MKEESNVSQTCCFLGHREIQDPEKLSSQLYHIVEQLITEQHVDTFLLGSKSAFNSLCYRVLTQLKERYPHIKRVYVRAEFPVIDDSYKAYLAEYYDDSYFPKSIMGAGKAVYIKRNTVMMDRSRFCIFYYDAGYAPKGRKSGTKIALDHAQKHGKLIFVLSHS